MEGLGILLFFYAILATAGGIIMLLLSIAFPKIAKAGMYILLSGGISFLLSMALCSQSGFNI